MDTNLSNERKLNSWRDGLEKRLENQEYRDLYNKKCKEQEERLKESIQQSKEGKGRIIKENEIEEMQKIFTDDAVEILYNRYVKNDPEAISLLKEIEKEMIEEAHYEVTYGDVFHALNLKNADELLEEAENKKTPNKETLEAMKESEEGGGIKCDSIEDFWEKMEISRN
jgi:hypothetical protein